MIRKWTIPVVVILIVTVLVPPLAGYGVFRRLQNRLKLKIEGTYVPLFFQPAFKVNRAYFKWEDKVEFIAGDIRVSYQPLSLVQFWGDENLRVHLSGKGAKVRLLGRWADIQGVQQEAPVEIFEAELGISKKGIKEIAAAEIVSPQFQFKIKKSDS